MTVGAFGAAAVQAREARNAARDDLGFGADAIVGHGVPGRDRHDAGLRREEREARFELFEAAVVGGDMEQRLRRAVDGARFVGEAREDGRVIAFRRAEDDLLAGQDGGRGCRRLRFFGLRHGSFMGSSRTEAVEGSNVDQQPGERAALEADAVQQPVLQVRIGQRQQLFERGEIVARHLGEPCFGIAAEQPVQFLGAAMLRAVERAAVARRRVDGHEACAPHAEGVCSYAGGSGRWPCHPVAESCAPRAPFGRQGRVAS